MYCNMLQDYCIHNSIICNILSQYPHVNMEMYVWWEVAAEQDEWKSVLPVNGAQYVMINGMIGMPEWFATNLDYHSYVRDAFTFSLLLAICTHINHQLNHNTHVQLPLDIISRDMVKVKIQYTWMV